MKDTYLPVLEAILEQLRRIADALDLMKPMVHVMREPDE